MNQNCFNDPQLTALESQLAALALQVSPAEQQRYLYECGMAAGRAKSQTALRRWKVFASTFAVAAAVMLVPHLQAARPANLLTSAPGKKSQAPELAVTQRSGSQLNALQLDAWQLPESELTPPDEIARLAQSDPNLRNRTVAALMSQALQH